MSETAIIADKNDQLLSIVNGINPDYTTGRFQDAIYRILLYRPYRRAGDHRNSYGDRTGRHGDTGGKYSSG